MHLPHIDEEMSASRDMESTDRAIFHGLSWCVERECWVEAESFLDDGVQVDELLDVRFLHSSVPSDCDIELVLDLL